MTFCAEFDASVNRFSEIDHFADWMRPDFMKFGHGETLQIDFCEMIRVNQPLSWSLSPTGRRARPPAERDLLHRDPGRARRQNRTPVPARDRVCRRTTNPPEVARCHNFLFSRPFKIQIQVVAKGLHGGDGGEPALGQIDAGAHPVAQGLDADAVEVVEESPFIFPSL
ncbi:MAG: hypothetical protein JNK37_04570 [Verrucomicrobiales bacterium]|nr:hypothetical protein [Verrucomicrobiales bacterium]